MTTVTQEEQIKFQNILRNVFLASGLLVFPLLTVLLYFFGDYPKSHTFIVLSVPMVGALVSVSGAVFMHFYQPETEPVQKQNSEAASAEESQPNTQRSGINLLEVLFFLFLMAASISGALWYFTELQKSGLAEDMQNASLNFIMDEAQPAEAMIEVMYAPVQRAVFIPSTHEGPPKGLVCAQTEAGLLKIYVFGKASRSSQQTSLYPVEMNSDIEYAAPIFCEAAFEKIN